MYKLTFIGILFFLISCKTEKQENAYDLAKEYCNCLEQQIEKAGDSSVNFNVCEKVVFSKSRFMEIEISENREQYSKTTLDSAFHFLLQVRNITDTMCPNKINWKKVKRSQPIKM